MKNLIILASLFVSFSAKSQRFKELFSEADSVFNTHYEKNKFMNHINCLPEGYDYCNCHLKAHTPRRAKARKKKQKK